MLFIPASFYKILLVPPLPPNTVHTLPACLTSLQPLHGLRQTLVSIWVSPPLMQRILPREPSQKQTGLNGSTPELIWRIPQNMELMDRRHSGVWIPLGRHQGLHIRYLGRGSIGGAQPRKWNCLGSSLRAETGWLNSTHLKGSDSAPSLGLERGLLARGQPESDLVTRFGQTLHFPGKSLQMSRVLENLSEMTFLKPSTNLQREREMNEHLCEE